MYVTVLGVAVAVLGAWLFVALCGAAPAWALWRSRLKPVGEDEAADALHKVFENGSVTSEWTAEAGFEPNAVSRIDAGLLQAVLVVWRRSRERTYCVFYLINDAVHSIDIVSCFGGGACLTTGTTRDGQLYPVSPGSWMQTFDAASIDDLWQKHVEGLQAVRSETGGVPTDDVTLFDDFHAALAEQRRYVESIPCWFLLTPYWYFTRRYSRHNRSVKELALADARNL